MPVKWGLLLSLLMLAILISLSVGKYPVQPSEVYHLSLALITGDTTGISLQSETVFWHIRLPRIMAAIVIGAVLSAAGSAYQGMFHNPLVSPDVLGVSAGAGFGALTGIFMGMSIFAIQALAFTGGFAVVGLVYVISRLARRQDPVLSMVLVGIAIGTLFTAASALLKVLADPYTQLPTITFWLLGGLSSITFSDLQKTLPVMLAGLLPLFLLRWRMNLLSLSDEEAQTLGINVQRNRLLFIFSATLITASAVSISGIIGWVGLVIPHIARLIVGPDFSRLLPASLIFGGIFLLLTDTMARTVAPIELPLGILTASIGAPFFILLLIRSGRKA